jgi:hypothetical protein
MLSLCSLKIGVFIKFQICIKSHCSLLRALVIDFLLHHLQVCHTNYESYYTCRFLANIAPDKLPFLVLFIKAIHAGFLSALEISIFLCKCV